MKKRHEKSRPAAGTARRLSSRKDENNRKNSVLQFAQFGKTKIPVVGAYRDPAGRWPAMPILDMPEETPEAWNAKARAMRKRKEGVSCPK